MNMEAEDFAGKSSESDLEQIEVALLVEAIYRRWGYDFRDYAPASLRRRIQRIVELEGLASISALQERLLRESSCMQRFIDQILVSVTSMFRDPGFYRTFRAEAIPVLRKQPSLRIWHAGCASGEEVYSMAIVLHQEGLLDRSRIYATDLDQAALNTAKNGIYPLSKMKEFTENYLSAGGETAFSEYYQAGHGHVAMRGELSKNVVWAQHNLVTDASFNEFHLIVCRNVLIYFNTELQARVHRLLYESLAKDGVLVLGRQETLQLTPHEPCFRAIDGREKIFQRTT